MAARPDLDLADVFSSALESALGDVHVALPALVTKYSASTNTCDAQPGVKRAIEKEDGALTHEKLPVCPNVPVMWPACGAGALAFDLVPGDLVLLVFSEAAWSDFRSKGGASVVEPGDLVRHSLSYPAAFPFRLTPTPGVGPRIVTTLPLSVGAAPLPTAFLARADILNVRLLAIETALGTLAGFPPYAGPPIACTKIRSE